MFFVMKSSAEDSTNFILFLLKLLITLVECSLNMLITLSKDGEIDNSPRTIDASNDIQEL